MFLQFLHFSFKRHIERIAKTLHQSEIGDERALIHPFCSHLSSTAELVNFQNGAKNCKIVHFILILLLNVGKYSYMQKT